VGRLALRFVKEDVRNNILALLGNMPVDTAANWMDIMRSNADYDFMRTWHYIDFAKEQPYVADNNENIVNRLLITYNELNHKKTLCTDQVRTDLLVLLHLMGDLHMPLHTAYDDDLGGNKRIVQYDTLKTHNLHTFWDEDIIRLTHISDETCLQYYNSNDADTLKVADFAAWMKDSRSLLDGVYDFTGFTLDKAYVIKGKTTVEKQLLKAALRLAYILNKLFYTPAPLANFKELTASYKNGINIKEAANNIGKKVTICARVVGIKASTGITQVSLDEKFPNCPLTVIIFGKNYSKFQPLEEWLKDKNICVQGTITEYKGKPQIVVELPEDITIL
jgi:DNA/RNA endonuclease YhcR with UshA esterase domain